MTIDMLQRLLSLAALSTGRNEIDRVDVRTILGVQNIAGIVSDNQGVHILLEMPESTSQSLLTLRAEYETIMAS